MPRSYTRQKTKLRSISEDTKKVLSIARLARDKKAEDIEVLDMKGLVDYTDYFVICSASSERTAKTIAEHIVASTAKNKPKKSHIEGYRAGEWILIDLGDVIVHIFQPDKREFYSLSRLWGDAPKVGIDN
ncbi:MAG: ribosome silencing factor [Candidatus Omnitrophota bacterium]